MTFKEEILEGIPEKLPIPYVYDNSVVHAPVRVIDGVLSEEEKMLAVRNALRYFDEAHHEVLAREFMRNCVTMAGYICTVLFLEIPSFHEA